MLHITNGDSVRLRDTGLSGEVVAWSDVLHEGPAPAGLTLGEFSAVRARFLASAGWGAEEEIAARFTARNAALEKYLEDPEVVLWFEHDLYDQLQLIQILDWFSTHERSRNRISLICIGKFPGIGRFKGLGELTAAQLASLFEQRVDVTLADYKQAAMAWQAFCSPDPAEIEFVMDHPSPALPFLKGALARHLEQFPSADKGLARTERQILETVEHDAARFVDVFLSDHDKEERVFMGETTFRTYVERLAAAPRPLVELSNDDIVRITPAGVQVMRGLADAVELNGIDRWLGGVHLQGPKAAWRWDADKGRLVAGAHRN